MNSFVQRHASSVIGMLSGWDRLRLRGTLRMLANLTGMTRFLSLPGTFVQRLRQVMPRRTSRRVREQALAVVERADRPVVHLDSPTANKEQVALEIAGATGFKKGIIAAVTAVESCHSYDVRSDRRVGCWSCIPGSASASISMSIGFIRRSG